MGGLVNPSGDLAQRKELMYEAAAMPGPYVRPAGTASWDFSALHDMAIPDVFEERVREYLKPVLNKIRYPITGWKLPETTLAYPWIARMFPDAYYVFLVRHPMDCILGGHKTDRLSDFGVEGADGDSDLDARALSWAYQYALVQSTPRPRRWIELRFEDLVLHQARELTRLEAFLDMPMARAVVRPESVGRYRRLVEKPPVPSFLREPIRALGYTDDGGILAADS